MVDLLFVQFIFIQHLFVQRFSSNPYLIGLEKMDWTKMLWTKRCMTKTGRTFKCIVFVYFYGIKNENGISLHHLHCNVMAKEVQKD